MRASAWPGWACFLQLENLEKAQVQRQNKLEKAQRDLTQKEAALSECDLDEAKATIKEVGPLVKAVTDALSKTEDDIEVRVLFLRQPRQAHPSRHDAHSCLRAQEIREQLEAEKSKHIHAENSLKQLDSVDERRKQQYKQAAQHFVRMAERGAHMRGSNI